MKITKALIKAVSTICNLTELQATTALNGRGIFRTLNSVETGNFESYKVSGLTGMKEVEGKVTLTTDTLISSGDNARLTSVLTLSATDFSYVPLVGETVFVKHPEDDEFYPCLVKSLKKPTLSVIGMVDGEAWETSVSLDTLYVPVYRATKAGLVSRSAYNHFFSGFTYEANGESVVLSSKEILGIAAKLLDLKLTFTSLYTYLTATTEEAATATAFFKAVSKPDLLGRQVDILNCCAITYLISGNIVLLNEPPENAEELPLLERFHIHVDGLKGTPLKTLYNEICKLSKIRDDDKETTASLCRASIKTLITSEARVSKLISAGLFA